MFERYTEHARRVIFFARYEASQFGSGREIDTEHLLLGLLRESYCLREWLGGYQQVEAVRQQIESQSKRVEKVSSTSVDLPLTHAGKRVLAYAAEEAERLNDKHVSDAHLVLGILREEDSLGARILRDHSLDLASVREKTAALSGSSVAHTRRPGFAFEPGVIQLVVGLAAEEAKALGQQLQPEHLLLGILRHANSEGARILSERGFTLEGLRARIKGGEPSE